ncbi:unnamed protein product [Brugia pahangi]|uniref:Uncharacterized protein n=1 Tax=Brugia pahangi TaxID=6280 RepID=A0A0N4TH17_BRUPA|nr:unnamed protein product [Brugia pahangi]
MYISLFFFRVVPVFVNVDHHWHLYWKLPVLLLLLHIQAFRVILTRPKILKIIMAGRMVVI